MAQHLSTDSFRPDCRDCPRLARFLDRVRQDHPGYYARPVPAFGDPRSELLIVGLAPGMHGANRTGRPFTGDFAGILLYRTLHQFGFASQAESKSADDSLRLRNCRISNAVKCLPPQNKPLPEEIRCCNRYLAAELRQRPPRAILALGSIAHQAVLMACGLRRAAYKFGHHAVHLLPPVPGALEEIRLFDSYHCSRYNTQTKRLTEAMFHAVFRDIVAELARR
jgi:uracil-DNA glycosylase family 4